MQLFSFFNRGIRWGWVVNATSWPRYLPEVDTFSLCTEGVGRTLLEQKISPLPATFSTFSLSLYFIRICFLALTVLNLVFLSLLTTHNKNFHAGFEHATPANDGPQIVAIYFYSEEHYYCDLTYCFINCFKLKYKTTKYLNSFFFVCLQ